MALLGGDKTKSVQQMTPVSRADAVLLILMGCSRAMQAYPATKQMMIMVSIERW